MKIDVTTKNDVRARELGFRDRFEMRAAIRTIADSMSEAEYDELSRERMEQLLRELAIKYSNG